jgi:hypothetical protein
MKTKKIIAIALLAGASLVISKTSSAQIRLGAVSSAHLSAATSVSTPSVSNALRASTAATAATASRIKTTGRQIEGKTTTAVSKAAATKVDASVESSTSVQASGQKQ